MRCPRDIGLSHSAGHATFNHRNISTEVGWLCATEPSATLTMAHCLSPGELFVNSSSACWGGGWGGGLPNWIGDRCASLCMCVYACMYVCMCVCM